MKLGVLAFVVVLILGVLAAGCTSPKHNAVEVEIEKEWMKTYQENSVNIFFHNLDDKPYRDVSFKLVDSSILLGSCSGHEKTLAPGEVAIGHCGLSSSDVTGNAILKYAISFSSSLEGMISGIKALSESEWTRESEKGQLNAESMDASFMDRNMRIDVHFAGKFPMINRHRLVMKIFIRNTGNGMISTIPPGSFYIEDGQMLIKQCYGMKRDGTRLVLANELKPIKDSFPEIDCVLEPHGTQVLNIYELKIHLDYNYKIMDTFAVRVVK